MKKRKTKILMADCEPYLTNSFASAECQRQKAGDLPLGKFSVPPVIFALVHGASLEDAENFAAVAIPGGIEAQERRGQTEQARLETLPVDGTSSLEQRKQFESLGFKFKPDEVAAQNQERGQLFVECEFPKGWRKASTDHAMWSDLLDDKGRRRGNIFYKAAFYDRSAHIYLKRRYSVHCEPVGGWLNKVGHAAFIGIVKDGDGIIFRTTPTAIEPVYDRDRADQRQAWLDWMNSKDEKTKEAESWVTKTYPAWEDVLAYWH